MLWLCLRNHSFIGALDRSHFQTPQLLPRASNGIWMGGVGKSSDIYVYQSPASSHSQLCSHLIDQCIIQQRGRFTLSIQYSFRDSRGERSDSQ